MTIRKTMAGAACAAVLAAAFVAITPACANDYPSRPIQLVVPFPPAGPADIVARPLAERLQASLGQPVVVVNKPGASGTLGADFVAKAEPDGYTLLLGTSNELTMSPGLYDKLPYDPSRNFVPITTVIRFPNVLVVNKDLPVKTAQDLVTLTRANAGKINYGTSGVGSTNHLTSELYRASTNVDLNYVPYRGGGPAMTDLIGGSIQAMFATMPSATGFIKTGTLRALMVTDSKRWAAIPDVPSTKEAGLPDVEVISFNGVLAPAGTPRPIIEKLHGEIVRIMNAPDMKAKMLEQAGEVSTTSPEEFANIIKADFAKWLAVIRAGNIKAN